MIRVLVVDDSAIAREALAGELEDDDEMRVVGTAADGDEAIAAVAELRPDVVTMDIQMPGGGGLLAIEQIMARTPVPIVVVSARARHDQTLSFEAVMRRCYRGREPPGAPTSDPRGYRDGAHGRVVPDGPRHGCSGFVSEWSRILYTRARKGPVAGGPSHSRTGMWE